MIRASAAGDAEEPAPAVEVGPQHDISHYLQTMLQSFANLELSGISDRELYDLSHALRTNRSVTSVNLSYCDAIQDDGIRTLAEGLRMNTTVTALNLSGCRALSDDGGAALARGLFDSPSLESLRLVGCVEIGDKTVELLAGAIAREEGGMLLRHLDVSGCRAITDASCARLGAALEKARCMESLVMQGCARITDTGAVALVHGVGQSGTMRAIDLSWCEQLGDKCFEAFAHVLSGGSSSSNRSLHSLHLACCVEATDDGARAIAKALERNASLTRLDLSWCSKLGDGALAAFVQALHRNRTLTTLELVGCDRIVSAGGGGGGGGGGVAAANARRMTRAQTLGSKKVLGAVNPVATDASAEEEENEEENDEAAAAAAMTPNQAAIAAASERRKSHAVGTMPGGSAQRRGGDGGGGGGAGQPQRTSAALHAELHALIESNRRRPKGLAASITLKPRKNSSTGSDGGGGGGGAGVGRGLSAADLAKQLRAAIVQGAAQYNAGAPEACLRLFKQTAESVIAATGSQVVQRALQQAEAAPRPPSARKAGALGAPGSPLKDGGAAENRNTLQQRIWALRCAFDQTLDELDIEEPT